MIFKEQWIARYPCYITSFLLVFNIFNKGTISCSKLPKKLQNNSSEKEKATDIFLNGNFESLNESKILEEVIYADIMNNLKNFIENNNNGTPRFMTHQSDVYLKNSQPNVEHTKPANESHELGNYYEIVKSLSIGNESVEHEGTESSLAHEQFDIDEMFLGYAGKPFETHKLTPQTKSEEFKNSEYDILRKEANDPRKKRSVLHLYNMVLCATGCNPLAYKGYGCYCGFLGSGFIVDGIDSCCKMHDWCYNSAGCPTYLEYFIPYLWKCYRRQPLCAIDHLYYGGPSSCGQRLCECDRQLALCLRRYPCPSTKALCTSSPLRLLQNILML